MTNGRAPLLDPRTAEEIAAAIVAQRAAFAPTWRLEPRTAGWALLQAYARHLRALGERINQAPDKNQLAFLDLLGLSLLAAQPARAVVVFSPLRTGDSRAPARARLGTKPAPGRGPLVFETENAIALAAARLAEVVTLWPGRDQYAVHTAEMLAGRAFTLFDHMVRTPHELYLAHQRLLALSGPSVVEIDVEISGTATRPVATQWEYWDGDVWRAFRDVGTSTRDSTDGTDRFTRSGVIRLVADCATTRRTTVGGIESYWVRARVTEAMPPDESLVGAMVDRIQLRTFIDRSLPATGCTRGLEVDSALADSDTLDTSKSFRPLGQNPVAGSAMYFSSAEAFAKAGARVTVCFAKAVTAHEEGDTLGAGYEVSINLALNAVNSLQDLLKALIDALNAVVDGTVGQLRHQFDALFAQDPQTWWKSFVLKPLEDALAAVKGAAVDPNVSLGDVLNAIFNPAALVTNQAYALARAIRQIGRAGRAITGNAAFDAKVTALDDAITAGDPVATVAAAIDLIGFIKNLSPGLALPQTVPALITDAIQAYDGVIARIDQARAAILEAIKNLGAIAAQFLALKPSDLAASRGITPPSASGPELAWEYYNGRSWRALVGPVALGPSNFTESGRVEFDVPQDWAESPVNGTSARWMRVRLARGSYNRMRQVSWYDQQSKQVNYLTILENRAPVLDSFKLGYVYRSPSEPADACLRYSDFQWTDCSDAARWRGDSFEPFVAVADQTPALYLGFDRPLPRDVISILADVEERADEILPPLAWEAWEGTAWIPMPLRDESRDLARPGIVAGVWPAEPPPAGVPVASGESTSVQLVDAYAAGRFVEGDQVVLAKGNDLELARVAGVAREVVTLRAPLARRYTSATMQIAGLPRFGTPRTWIRARMKHDGEPARVRVNGLHLNAVWAVNRDTFESELLGSGRAEPNQTLFFTHSPVLPGEMIEVRELDGARAHVEWPMLRAELEAAGVAHDSVRLARDSRTNRVTEVWVPWSVRHTLAFSGSVDRHYVIERSTGRVLFGDDRHGRVLPAGADNVRARHYDAGGGAGGNVSIGAISQILSGVVAEKATNPRAAEGGANGETIEEVLVRGPRVMRHREQAISASDYEALAREASPGVALAKALPTTDPSGRRTPGWVRVIIVPKSSDARPWPTLALRESVLAFIAARSPATAARGITVAGPSYLPVGVEAVIVPVDFFTAGPVVERVTSALSSFLHPLTGGPERNGWPFGRAVHLSDIAAVVEGVDGVDYARTLVLLADGTPVGASVTVPPDRILVAGPLRIRVAAGEE